MRPVVLTAVLTFVAGCAAEAGDPSPPRERQDVEMVSADDGAQAPAATVASVRRITNTPAPPGPLGQSSNDPWQSVLGPVPDPWQPPPAPTATAAPSCPGSRP
jgi:hypothetical protein